LKWYSIKKYVCIVDYIFYRQVRGIILYRHQAWRSPCH